MNTHTPHGSLLKEDDDPAWYRLQAGANGLYPRYEAVCASDNTGWKPVPHKMNVT